MKNKLISILISVVVAFSMWLYVITVVSPGSKNTFYDIPVRLEGASILEERGLMVTDVDTTSVDLELSGNRVDLNELSSSNITIKANLSSIYDPDDEIQLAYTIAYPGNVASNAFTVESRSPGYITVSVERIANKTIPVNVVTSGSVMTGYVDKSDEMILDYEEIQISGPASVVEQITQARIDVSLADLTESVNQSYRYTLCDATGEPVNSELITVNAKEVMVLIPVQQTKIVKLTVNFIDGGGVTGKMVTYSVDPVTIQVCGSKAALAELGNELVIGTVDLAECENGAVKTFAVNLPSGITNMSGVEEANVTLTLPKLETKTFSINRNDVKLVNVPEGMEAELLKQVLTITVRGSAEQISALAQQHITASVDFTGAEPGTSFYQVTVTIHEDFNACGAMEIESVSAEVRKTGK